MTDAEGTTTRPGATAPTHETVATDTSAETTTTHETAAEAPATLATEELALALAQAQAQRDEYLDDLRRARAEFENYRKRVVRESASQREAGRADVVGSLLDVLDDLDRTLGATEQSSDVALAKGVELVASKLVGTLRGQGLERIDDVDVPFDPTRHEAVQHVPVAHGDGQPDQPTVVEVVRPGYRLGEVVLRAAMVTVKG